MMDNSDCFLCESFHVRPVEKEISFLTLQIRSANTLTVDKSWTAPLKCLAVLQKRHGLLDVSVHDDRNRAARAAGEGMSESSQRYKSRRYLFSWWQQACLSHSPSDLLLHTHQLLSLL
jgi:hypothetical protein